MGDAAASRVLRAFLAALITFAVVSGGVTVMLRSLENSLIFFPTRELLSTPAEYGLDYETIKIAAADGVSLHGWWIPSEPERGVLLFFHGNAGNIGDRIESVEIFHRLGLSVLIVDYRGYGSSEGDPSEEGTYRDAEAAWGFLVGERGVDPGRVIVFGRSLGAAVATHLVAGLAGDEVAEKRPALLILESAFTSVPDMAAAAFPFLPARMLARTRYDNLDRVGRVGCPVLVVHSRGDEIVPFDHGRRLFESARDPRAFLEIRGGHNDGFLVSGQAYVDGIDAFLSRHLDHGHDES